MSYDTGNGTGPDHKTIMDEFALAALIGICQRTDQRSPWHASNNIDEQAISDAWLIARQMMGKRGYYVHDE